ncbi:MAG: ParB/RepB/Spo0J family partition protein [Candidatus Competibacteraceae bacterium]|nr:ParB/RepB/Spo0J family partition protein [Candidatus Contendobacter odensis]MBK8534598.1 ParB/RepB/Spo0J family partition protein [Candidatus Competibacteraceae bacterium]MBK8750973.1 ParB/RepB/Spo0J family partition protein [Candidatus Competibacteraceae bacterium]
MEELIQSIQQPVSDLAVQPRVLPIDNLKQGRYQPRQAMDEPDIDLIRLADSIRALGLIEPIAVRPLPEPEGHFEILAGGRRWRAARLAGLAEVAVIVHAVDDQTAAAMALVENLQRQDLNPLEAATAMQRLREEFKLSQDQLGRLLGISKSMISRTLGLLSLHKEVQMLLRTNQLDAGHARVLLTLAPEEQIGLARQAIAKGWSVRELEQRKADLAIQRESSRPNSLKVPLDPDLRHLESLIGSWLATPVRLTTRKTGEGFITICFASADECTGILQKIGFNLEKL